MFAVGKTLRGPALGFSCLAAFAAGVSCEAGRPVARREDRPPFYSPTNVAEYYGRCPRCSEWVKGYWGIRHYGDAEGQRVWAESAYRGRCEHCGAYVSADNFSASRPGRIVQWRLDEVQAGPVP